MKKTALTLILLSSFVSANVIAAESSAAVQARVEQVKSEFNLNEQQAKRIANILNRAGMDKEEKRAARVEKRIQHKIKRMTAKLGLDDTQADQLKELLTQQHEQMQALRTQGKADITAILTPEQAATFAEMRTKRKGWRGNSKHRKRGGHGRTCDQH